MPPKRAPSPDPTKKRLIKRKVNPPETRSARENNYVEMKAFNVIKNENVVFFRIASLQQQLEELPATPENSNARARIIDEMQRLLKYKQKLDNDYGHWDDIIDNGYDRDDSDDENYPPPSPPPPNLSTLLTG